MRTLLRCNLYLICLVLFALSLASHSAPREEVLFKKDAAAMRLIPAATYTIGSESEIADVDEKPAHPVKLDDFYIDKYEVTNAQYRTFLTTTGHREPKYWNDETLNQPEQPVVGVSWDDAAAYAEWAEKRLPTEAEWEVAARGSEERVFPWGNEFDLKVAATTIHANIIAADDGFEKTAVVGSFTAGESPFGVQDLAGNVFEWVADWYAEDYYDDSPLSNPQGPAEGNFKVLRGGSWRDGGEKARSAKRSSLPGSMRHDEIGFRCAISLADFLDRNADPWDVDKSGEVNIFDLVLVASNFGVADAEKGDVNSDGKVDIFDLVLVANHFGEASGAAAAPSIVSARTNLDDYQLHRIQSVIRQLEHEPNAETRHVLNLLRILVDQPITETRLLTNYPNPFNPETWIPFRLSTPHQVTIEIYTASGQLVRSLPLGVLPAGGYTTKERSAYWNGKNDWGTPVSSGLYFSTLRLGQVSADLQSAGLSGPSFTPDTVQPMILLK